MYYTRASQTTLEMKWFHDQNNILIKWRICQIWALVLVLKELKTNQWRNLCSTYHECYSQSAHQFPCLPIPVSFIFSAFREIGSYAWDNPNSNNFYLPKVSVPTQDLGWENQEAKDKRKMCSFQVTKWLHLSLDFRY